MNQTRQPKESGGVYILLDFMCNVDEQTRIIFEDPRRRTSPIPKYFPEASMDEIGRKEILSSRKTWETTQKSHMAATRTVEQSNSRLRSILSLRWISPKCSTFHFKTNLPREWSKLNPKKDRNDRLMMKKVQISSWFFFFRIAAYPSWWVITETKFESAHTKRSILIVFHLPSSDGLPSPRSFYLFLTPLYVIFFSF